tara:strand:- start:376 stop:1914 length:1539 start_codon:yes stop_codon:yes gene_type:complete
MIKTQNLVAGDWQDNSKAQTFQTVNPKTKKPLPYLFQETNKEQINIALNKASAIFDHYATTSFKDRIVLLKAIQAELIKSSDFLLEIYEAESAFSKERSKGEFQRTLGQIERFIELLEEGSFVQPIIHLVGLDLRKILNPIGPICIFGASNFPLAFSTAGGDTISALSAGCPVIIKAHPYHAATSALVAEAIHKAIISCGFPLEIFSHLSGNSHSIGRQLIMHPLLKGVGFTGSYTGGKALYDIAQTRPEPIPVFAEMGSVNPIFITESRLSKDKNLAEKLAGSIALGTGQFCTNPGFIVFCDPRTKSNIVSQVRQKLSEFSLPPMVHANIEKNYLLQLDKFKKNSEVNLSTSLKNNSAIGLISAESLIKNQQLSEEVFGPFSLFVHCRSLNEMEEVANMLPGQLTGTLLSQKEEYSELNSLITIMKNKVGRLLFEGVPTGVAVIEAMHHGGPFPASTDARYTSVGTDSIYRWLRPVAFQDCPNQLLPPALQNENPLGLNRIVNGKQTKNKL